MNPPDELNAALAPVVAAFEQLEVRYCVGGSVASSFHGASRSTMDVDLLCELTEGQVPDFLACFDTDYYRRCTRRRAPEPSSNSARHSPDRASADGASDEGESSMDPAETERASSEPESTFLRAARFFNAL